MKRVIFNLKGGVGKTSVTCNLAAAFAKAGMKVLVIDLDPQCNTTQYLLGQEATIKKTIADFFESTLSFKLFQNSLSETLHQSPYKNLDVIPASSALTEMQSKLESRYKVMKLSQALDILASFHSYDQVLIDTPPALNFYSMSAMLSADKVLIPFDCDEFSVKALEQVAERIEDIKSDYRPQLQIEGVIVNHFQSQANLPKIAIDSLHQKGFQVLRPFLSSSIIMKESHSASTPLVYFKPKHKLSCEYTDLAKSLVTS